MNDEVKKEIIVFGGGCFWCTEAIFSQLRGVESVLPGYAGGDVPNPTYEHVCDGNTGHAEVIKLVFKSGVIALEDILSVFFATHNPTTLNRQGADIGTQYRSAIFYTSDEQKKSIDNFIKKLIDEKIYDKNIVTEIKPLAKFYEAEKYHQKYYEKNPEQGYCQVVINPKLEKLKKKYAQLII